MKTRAATSRACRALEPPTAAATATPTPSGASSVTYSLLATPSGSAMASGSSGASAAATASSQLTQAAAGLSQASAALPPLPGELLGQAQPLLAPARGATVGRPARGSSVGIIASKSVLLLLGGLAIGALAGPAGMRPVQPFFIGLFPGVLCLFLLELGRLAAERLGDFAKVGGRLLAFSLLAPVAHAALGLLVAAAAGLGEGGAVVFATLCASASYIAAPAAVRAALPEANPSLYLTCALGITFPFNIVVGLPLYQAMAAALYR